MNTRAFDLDNIFKNLQCEKLHLKFSKFLLGVHKKSVNFAVLSELGRSPLHFNIVISRVKYWYRLVNLSIESKLLLVRDSSAVRGLFFRLGPASREKKNPSDGRGIALQQVEKKKPSDGRGISD